MYIQGHQKEFELRYLILKKQEAIIRLLDSFL